MPASPDFPYPRRYNSLRLLGFDYGSTSARYFVIRNDADLRETIEHIAQNPVKRGYASKPQFYPFTGFGVDASEGG